MCSGWVEQSSVGVSLVLIAAARSAVAWSAALLLQTRPRKLPVLAASPCRLCAAVLACLGGLAAPQPNHACVSVRVPDDPSQQPTAERDPPRTRGFSGILSLELCVRLLRCCVSALISAVCSTTLSCTADPVAGADLLRCSRYKESIADPSQHCHHAAARRNGHRGRAGAARPQDGS